MSLELILANRLSVEVAVAVGLPPVCCSSKQLVCCKENLLMARTLSYLQLLLNRYQPILCIHGILCLRKGSRVSPQKFSQPRQGRWWWRCLLLLILGMLLLLLGLLVRLKMLKGLQHCLHKLVLVGNVLLKL
jgi:hypothetical protein